MKFLTPIAIIVGAVSIGHADSGGRYEGVPDLKENEKPPVFQIPATKEPLRYYLQHKPKLNLNREFNEPDSYTWTKVSGHYASFRVLGHVRGRELYEVRYVSDNRIDQGLDYADAILILARGIDTAPGKEHFEAIYFLTGGNSNDRRAKYLREIDKYGAVKITNGTGPERSHSVYIRGTKEFDYERFIPAKAKTENRGGGKRK